jgi:TIR domain
MAYVPGFEHDVFVSYAHGDDREWIDQIIGRLKQELKRRHGIDPVFWIDEKDLRASRDYRKEIPTQIDSCAIFLFFPSPCYIRSEYCVRVECPHFRNSLGARRNHFRASEFANEQFALRCPLLPIDNDEHMQLFPGLDDIAFCDHDSDTFPDNSSEFRLSLNKLTRELKLLLQRMRNASTPVFLYPTRPGPTVRDAHESLAKELTAWSYRLLPDRLVSLSEQLREAALSVFLLDDVYDETLNQLAQDARTIGKPWVIWCSQASLDGVPRQLGLIQEIERMDSPTKTLLQATNISNKLKELKEAVFDPLRPNALPPRVESDKPRIYLVYNSKDRRERGHAGKIVYHFNSEFQFDHPDDPAQHSARLATSDGVLLLWGSSDENWCAPEFQSMVQVSRRALAKGLCLFDPPGEKEAVAKQIRARSLGICVLEQFGGFDPIRMESFFNPIRRGSAAGAS